MRLQGSSPRNIKEITGRYIVLRYFCPVTKKSDEILAIPAGFRYGFRKFLKFSDLVIECPKASRHCVVRMVDRLEEASPRI